VFKELVALLPDEPRRRALLESYTAKLHARRAQQGDFPSLMAGDAPSSSISSASSSVTNSASSTYTPNASVGPSYRSMISRGGGSASWSSEVSQGLSSTTAFPSLPASQPGGAGRGNAAGGSAWGANDANASSNNSASNASGRGRGKKKQVLSAW